MDKHETTADVIAAMRDEGRTGESSCLEWVGAKMRDYADRFEAAHKRESGVAVTGSNQLREALWQAKEIARTIYSTSDKGSSHEDLSEKLVEIANAALAAPPRNCDLYATVDEARKAHEAICEKYVKCHNGCPLNNEEHYSAFDCFEAWLFAPATEKEGGAK